jgi:hypothetical protein
MHHGCRREALGQSSGACLLSAGDAECVALLDAFGALIANTAETLAVWPRARELAIEYWNRVAEDPRITRAFRARAVECRDRVEHAAPRHLQRS